MATQKQKFELYNKLQTLGFTYEEAHSLRRIEMVLHGWCEKECGDSNDHNSFCIARDEETDQPYMEIRPNNGKMYRYPIADREKGALQRLKVIINKHPALWSYYQTDPRGCALYVGRTADLYYFNDGNKVLDIESNYSSRGLAVCI